jgi:hypothetical protein
LDRKVWARAGAAASIVPIVSIVQASTRIGGSFGTGGQDNGALKYFLSTNRWEMIAKVIHIK